VDYVMTYVQKTANDEAIFPTKVRKNYAWGLGLLILDLTQKYFMYENSKKCKWLNFAWLWTEMCWL
jgi:hypothetical protein